MDLNYDQDTDRLASLTGPGLPAGGAHYSYLADSHLVEKVEFKASGGAVRAASVRAYEAERDLLTSIENRWGSAPATISKYEYANDELGRREHVIRTGAAFAAGHADVWTYNGRNELTRSDRYEDTQPPLDQNEVAALRRIWQYDPIGNRTESALGTQPTMHYCANGLNQYESRAADPNCVSAVIEEYAHDADGNLTQDGHFRYFWDAENRLVAVEAREPAGPEDVRLEFDYDYMNRRVEKRVYAWDPNAPGGPTWSAAASLTRRFVWYNWLLLAELDEANVALKKHTWGLDLSGTLEGAGGIGGLLAVAQAELGGGYAQGGVDAGDYVPFYDANGNVGQLVDPAHDPNDPSGAIAARYEYDAYGNVIGGGGAYAEANAWRFSTKWWDEETGLGYWGQRYYSSPLGRWLCRDRIQERGGANTFRYCLNDPIGSRDAVGNIPQSSCGLDITARLFQLTSSLTGQFLGADARTKLQACKVLVTQSGWDIAHLAAAGSASRDVGRFSNGCCGIGNCRGSVQVLGNCYRANEVNYIIFGLASYLCHHSRPVWAPTLLGEIGGATYYMDVEGGHVHEGFFTLDWALDLVRIFRIGGAIAGIHEQASPAGAGSIACRQAWVKYGYTGDRSGLGACVKRDCAPCNQSYGGPLSAHIGIIRARVGP